MRQLVFLLLFNCSDMGLRNKNKINDSINLAMFSTFRGTLIIMLNAYNVNIFVRMKCRFNS